MHLKQISVRSELKMPITAVVFMYIVQRIAKVMFSIVMVLIT